MCDHEEERDDQGTLGWFLLPQTKLTENIVYEGAPKDVNQTAVICRCQAVDFRISAVIVVLSISNQHCPAIDCALS
jgi:hypothetical protein